MSLKACEMPVASAVGRIAVISRMTYGDFVLMLPFLSELRRRHPTARITILCGRRGSSLCRLLPSVNDVVNLGELRPGHGSLGALGRLLTLLRSDLIYALYPIFSAAVIAFLLGGRWRIGFSQASARLFAGHGGFKECASVNGLQQWLLSDVLLHESVPMQARDSHASSRFLQLLGTEMEAAPSLRGQLSAIYPRVHPARPRVILAPFSGWTPRNWPLDRWVGLARRLREAAPTLEILVSVDPPSETLARIAFAGFAGAEIFVPGEDFDRLFRTFATAALIVSNDSFPLHAASALNVPSVGLFGPNLPKWFGGMAEAHDDLFHSIECNPCVQGQGQEPCLRGLATCAALEAWSAEAVAARCLAVLESGARPTAASYSASNADKRALARILAW